MAGAQDPQFNRVPMSAHDAAGLARLLETVVTSATDAVLITDAGTIEEAEGGPRVVYANEAFSTMTGYPAEEIVGRTPRILQCDETNGLALRRIRTALTNWTPVEEELLNRRSDGRMFWVQVSISPAYDAGGCLTHWVSIQRDITARRLREEAERRTLRVTQDRLRGAFAHAPIGMAVASPTGELLEVNPALARLLGHSMDSFTGRTLFEITHPDDRSAAEDACRGLASGSGLSRVECRFEHAAGREMDVIVHASLVRDAGGEPDHVILHVEDVSERNAMELELVARALSDDLTQLPNRAMLLDRLAQAVARRNRDGSALALFFIDVDGFKDVNDTFGHAAGDELLVALARRLQQTLRPGDTAARFGGDEFVVLCERTAPDEAPVVVQRLSAAVAQPLELAGGTVRPTVSIGVVVATGPEHAVPEALLREADAAMYEAKRRGPGRSVTFDGAMRERDAHRAVVEGELRRALERGELELHYQPQLQVADRAVAGVEALVRWRHPERGLVGPRDFVPLAERTGLIADIGDWVTGAACAYAARATHTPVVWINLSARQLRPGLVAEIAGHLHRAGLAPERLGLELTESVLMHDLGLARSVLTGLRDLGVRLAIDDFGTGYSSLAYIAELPVDTVKVDRAFAARLTAGARGRTVIAAVVGMARALDLHVVVEGVETAEQLEILRELDVSLVQGYLLGPPAAG